MANEFVARKGLISLQTSSFYEDVNVSGSVYIGTFATSSKLSVSGSGYISKELTVDGGITGSLHGTSSWAITASYALSYSGTSGTSGTSGIDGISGGKNYLFNYTVSSSLSGYKTLGQLTTTGSEQTLTVNLTSNQQNVLVDGGFATVAGDPNVIVIPNGLWHTYA